MNVVGRVGSLISQGVYSVATPFHPFGGAVDVVVVKQEDGTYRSTPWYVRFGKFQGVLKGAEKIVEIAVNGNDASFHMYLDNSGEAYFLREVPTRTEDSVPSDLVSETNQDDNTNSNTYNAPSNVDNTEFPDEIHSYSSDQISSYGSYQYGSLEDVEDLVNSEGSDSEVLLLSVDGHVLAAPFSSTEENTENVQLDTPQFHLGPGEGSGVTIEEDSGDFSSNGEEWASGLFVDLGVSKPDAVLANGGEDDGCLLGATGDDKKSPTDDNVDNAGARMSRIDVFKSCLELTELNLELVEEEEEEEGDVSQDIGSLYGALNVQYRAEDSQESSLVNTMEMEGVRVSIDLISENIPSPGLPCSDGSQTGDVGTESSVENAPVDGDVFLGESDHIPICSVNDESELKEVELSPSSDTQQNDGTQHVKFKMEILENTSEEKENVGCTSEDEQKNEPIGGSRDQGSVTSPEKSATEEESKTSTSGGGQSGASLGFEISLCGNVLRANMGHDSAREAFDSHRIFEEEFKASGASIIKNGNLIVRYEENYFPWTKAAPFVLGKAVFGSDFPIDAKDAIPVKRVEVREDFSSPSGRRWRLWPIPFRSFKTLQHSDSNSSADDVYVDSESVLQSSGEEPTPNQTTVNQSQSPRKQFVRTNVPTNEQIASLNLKDGQNVVTFSFSTRVWGKQQVDAHIYLWKWNTRIVISDVDGTITKSDVLGQFMPLVGKDWTQSGVARLFSAIKENGYQLLFLSARAIVQAYLTRSFLLNLKQDGNALPNGPVVISPDGLFPSLYREVIRRAPHEFKIACLEDIRALFPSDHNPFYAGFGNRDTDELSYRKIGIPKGKIFIINPKGEVAINQRVDVKSYTSLHTLVNDMFPPTSLAEQEDFNSWNYWKLPLPSIDL
ncbi:hypothetical protein QJS04_geneDACA017900 [Acorus gramineus]|uniref:phosphatidate phosphatase n=1 Tax=Acorus gramineus TaxID=55184 RepID=A0AAV9ALE7_ACOGR|nr:hypothetical protein QJS04_geneDACA017900 [Acorus gramineus]